MKAEPVRDHLVMDVHSFMEILIEAVRRMPGPEKVKLRRLIREDLKRERKVRNANA